MEFRNLLILIANASIDYVHIPMKTLSSSGRRRSPKQALTARGLALAVVVLIAAVACSAPGTEAVTAESGTTAAMEGEPNTGETAGEESEPAVTVAATTTVPVQPTETPAPASTEMPVEGIPEAVAVDQLTEGVKVARNSNGVIVGIQINQFGAMPGGLDQAKYLQDRSGEWMEVRNVVEGEIYQTPDGMVLELRQNDDGGQELAVWGVHEGELVAGVTPLALTGVYTVFCVLTCHSSFQRTIPTLPNPVTSV